MALTGPATPDDEPAKDNTFIAALYFQCKDAGDFYFCPVGSIDAPFFPGEKRCGHCIHLDTIERFLAQRLFNEKSGIRLPRHRAWNMFILSRRDPKLAKTVNG